MIYGTAADAFPWAGIDRGVTLQGLFDHRHGRYRREYAAVMAGSDMELTHAVVLLHAGSAKMLDFPVEALEAFAAREIKRNAEQALFPIAPADLRERMTAFGDGWRAAGAARAV